MPANQEIIQWLFETAIFRLIRLNNKVNSFKMNISVYSIATLENEFDQQYI